MFSAREDEWGAAFMGYLGKRCFKATLLVTDSGTVIHSKAAESVVLNMGN